MVKVAILHEGNAKKTNDNELLKLLIRDNKLDSDRVIFFGMGEKNNFFKSEHPSYKNLKNGIENEEINKLLFVADADYEHNDKKYGGYKNTENALKNIIDELGFQDYSDIYIVCDPETKEGYLESLILSTIPLQHKNCIQDFLSCSEFKSKDNHKSILNQIYKMAYPNKPYDFSHENFDNLTDVTHPRSQTLFGNACGDALRRGLRSKPSLWEPGYHQGRCASRDAERRSMHSQTEFGNESA